MENAQWKNNSSTIESISTKGADAKEAKKTLEREVRCDVDKWHNRRPKKSAKGSDVDRKIPSSIG